MLRQMKFEYAQLRIVTATSSQFESPEHNFWLPSEHTLKSLEKLGQEGWELAAGIHDPENPSQQLLILKREKPET